MYITTTLLIQFHSRQITIKWFSLPAHLRKVVECCWNGPHGAEEGKDKQANQRWAIHSCNNSLFLLYIFVTLYFKLLVGLEVMSHTLRNPAQEVLGLTTLSQPQLSNCNVRMIILFQGCYNSRIKV